MLAHLPITAWSDLADLPVAPLAGGLINDTFAVGRPPVAVVQRLHPIFKPRLHLDLEVITAWVADRGLLTPRLLRTTDGGLWTIDDEERCWRALSWVPGRTVDQLDDPALARAAGALVGRWHEATRDLEHDFEFVRPGAHNTDAHMAHLTETVQLHGAHPLHGDVAPLAAELVRRWNAWEGRLDGPVRVCHGDLKISNLRFDDRGVGLCLLDLDTMANLPLDIEMGDAMRSWCNPRGEDVSEAEFQADLFSAAMQGWRSSFDAPPEDTDALVPGIERIGLELASRFAADALTESYFGWDPGRFQTRGTHNLLRAQGQLSLARSVARQRLALEACLKDGS
jgi:Ser/Thr protein kinase RdoA (MazF antagonist)